VVRIEGAAAKFLRPDERSLATLIQKSLQAPRDAPGLVEVRPGISVADGGLDVVLSDMGNAMPFWLEEGAPDIRSTSLVAEDIAFFVGDHLGLDPTFRARLVEMGARPVGLGPIAVHADDAIAIVSNELDRRQGGR
jgi:tRNA (pseudouridine54-N1)-methyltransferase